MKLGKKILIACIAVVLLFLAEYVIYYLLHYVFFDDYKDTLSSYSVREASEYKALGQGSGDLADFDLVAKNDKVELYAQPLTGYIAVKEIATGNISYSNPLDADKDEVANDKNKGKLKSQVIVTFFNEARTTGSFTSYDNAILMGEGQTVVESIKDGVRFTFTMKDKTPSIQCIPLKISQERFDAFYAKMDPSSKEAKQVIKQYKLDEETGFYNLMQGLYTIEDDNSITTSSSKKPDEIKRAFYEQAGYTEEEYLIDMEDSGYTLASFASFTVAVDYVIENDSLVVDVPTSLIKENKGKIATVELLPAFGAASTQESGYILVPNGSGSLIYFNNGKNAASDSDYAAFIYGIDPLAADYTVVENSEQARLPLFALCRENSSILAVIEDGASFAQIKSQVSGRSNSYNSADFTFTLRGNEKMSMFGTAGNAATIPIVETNYYDVNLRIRYSFLDDKYTGYSGVANYYREQLIAQGKLTQNGDTTSTQAQDIGLYYDLIGSVKVTDFFVGVKYLSVMPMTTYDQATTIANELNAAGISNQIVNYQGWFNGGYYHDVTSRLKLVNKLGSEKSLESLSALVEGFGGKVYGDAAFQKVTYISKKYNSFNESARYYAGYAGMLGQINPTTLRQTASLGYEETLYSLVSPKFLVRYVDKFISNTEKIDITGLSLRDLGDTLASDKKRTELINREEALDVVVAQLEKFAATDKNIMVSGGNNYAVSYADDLINVPTGHNAYYSVDDEVPFYEMVYHGTVDYSGTAINMSDNYDIDDITLRLIEYGCAPHFTLTYNDANDMKYTGLNSYYSTTYSVWKDTITSVYSQVNGALKYVKNANIVKHEIVGSGLKKVTYSNGVIFYINTTNSSAVIDGVTVAAKNYEMGGLN